MAADRYGYERLSLRIRLLERYKGVQSWQVGEIRTVPIVPDTESPKGRSKWDPRFSSSLEMVPPKEMRLDPGHGCSALFVNETTLAEVRRGIEEDYSATDPVN